jgi:hypothetical protein
VGKTDAEYAADEETFLASDAGRGLTDFDGDNRQDFYIGNDG